MATIRKFEDLEIWQLARELNLEIFPILEKLHELRMFELKNQLERSAGSVMDNIAEGYERDGTREFIQFLAISKGSLGEVRSQLYRAMDRKVIDAERNNYLQEKCLTLASKITKFITYLNNSDMRGNKFKKDSKLQIISSKDL
jgi:four helix bundle protein